MNQTLIKNLQIGEVFEGFLLVRTAEKRTAKNGASFIDINFGDKTGDVNAKNWDINADAPTSGTIVKVQADIIEFNKKPQLKIKKIRALNEGEDIPMDYFVKCAPTPYQVMMDEVLECINHMHNKDIQSITLALFNDVQDKLVYFPAAKEMHHAERAGLLHHITDMLKVAKALSMVYTWLNWDLVNAGIILHDLQKTTEMLSDSFGVVKEYSKDGLLVGHIVRGAINLQQKANELGTNPEVVELLMHMILSHHGIAEYGSPRPPMFGEAEMLHMIDTLDAKMFQIKDELNKLNPGVFSEFVRPLERRLYKPDLEHN